MNQQISDYILKNIEPSTITQHSVDKKNTKELFILTGRYGTIAILLGLDDDTTFVNYNHQQEWHSISQEDLLLQLREMAYAK